MAKIYRPLKIKKNIAKQIKSPPSNQLILINFGSKLNCQFNEIIKKILN